MKRVAAFDCGTNTIKVLVAELSADTGEQVEIMRDMRMVRLGQDVDRTGRFQPEALERAFAAIDDFAALVKSADVEAIRFCATSAARDASNGDAFLRGVRARVGIQPEVLSGDEEARLSYDGATRSLPDLRAPILVVDIGGGSTELVTQTTHRSLDMGSVRMTERFLHDDPPSPEQIVGAVRSIDSALDSLPTGLLADAAAVVGVAGTVTTVAAMALGLPEYDRAALHHAAIETDDVAEVASQLLGMTVAERRTLPFMHPGRADVIAAGALIFERVLARTDVRRVLVSESDILDGIAWSMA